jgi:hypothetical protein
MPGSNLGSTTSSQLNVVRTNVRHVSRKHEAKRIDNVELQRSDEGKEKVGG